MTDADDALRFSGLFDRAVSACARAQLLATRCRESQARARATHASARRLRTLAAGTRAAWAAGDRVLEVMRLQVEAVAQGMRDDGIERQHAGAAIRAHMRFVLYDSGLAEQEAEPVVAHASGWVDRIYEAA